MKNKSKKTHTPWNSVKTRKFSFVYCLILGTAVIAAAAIMIPKGVIDTATWLTESLKFAKYIVGTGTVIVTLSTTDDVIKFLKGEKIEEHEDSEEE